MLSGQRIGNMACVVCSTLALAVPGSMAAMAPPQLHRTIKFSGYAWRVKSGARPLGPGPNYFSNSVNNVRVDCRDRLHLKLTHANGHWYCAEVINTRSLGRGRYNFELGSAVDSLDPNVVLGLFTWSVNPTYHNREIDIECARFGNAADPTNGDFVVQPYFHRGNLRRFTQPAVSRSTHSFYWRRHLVGFASSSASPSAWTYAGPDVPQPGSEHVHINLWLYRGNPPTSDRSVEIVVKRFSFSRAD